MFLSNTLSNKKHLSRQALYPRRERRGFTAWSGKQLVSYIREISLHAPVSFLPGWSQHTYMTSPAAISVPARWNRIIGSTI